MLGLIAVFYIVRHAPRITSWVRVEIRWRCRPLVYVCESNGTRGLVISIDHRRTLRKHWRKLESEVRMFDDGRRCSMSKVSTTFLFTQDVWPGLAMTAGEFRWLTRGCRIVTGDFKVLPEWYIRRQGYASTHTFSASFEKAAVAIHGVRKGNQLVRVYRDFRAMIAA